MRGNVVAQVQPNHTWHGRARARINILKRCITKGKSCGVDGKDEQKSKSVLLLLLQQQTGITHNRQRCGFSDWAPSFCLVLSLFRHLLSFSKRANGDGDEAK
jgi:hypothetical protein